MVGRRSPQSGPVISVYTIVLGLIVLTAMVLRISYLDHGLWPDEALYAGGGYSLYSTGDLTFNGEVWKFHPPFFLVMIACSHLIFGPTEFAPRVVSPLFGVAGVVATYYLGKYLYDRKIGLAAAFFISIAPLHWFLSERILLDVPFTTVLTATVALFYQGHRERNQAYLLASSVGMAILCLTKSAGLVVYPILFLYLFSEKRDWFKDRSLAAVFGLSVALQMPWYARNLLVTGNPFGFKPAIYGGSPFYYLDNLAFITSPPVLLASVMGVVLLMVKRKLSSPDRLVLFFILGFLAVISIWPEKAPRYALPTVPFFGVLAAEGIWEASRRLDRDNTGQVFVIILLSYSCISGVSGYSYGKALIRDNAVAYKGLDEAGRWLRMNSPEDAVIVTSSIRSIHYYSQRKCIPYPRDKADIPRLLSGQKVIYLETDIWASQPEWVYPYTEGKAQFMKELGFEKVYTSKLPYDYEDIREVPVVVIFERSPQY